MFSALSKGSLRKAISVCKAVAAGDFEARISNITEVGEAAELMHAINLMIDRTDAYLRESKACLDYVSRNQHFRRIEEKGMLGSFAQASASINSATEAIRDRHDNFRELAENFEARLQEIVDAVSSSTATLEGVAEDVSKASSQASEQSLAVAAGAEEASGNMQNVSAATEELTGSIGEINRQVMSAADVASSAVAKSETMSQQINSLADVSSRIGDVVKMINDIAAQTNLLALNATIEAARAGEAGRGFAIVAQEVKILASQTAGATEEIGAQIAGLQQATSDAVFANREISEAIVKVSEISTAIASAVEEQSAATGEIARNVEEAASGTANVTYGISQVSEATQSTQTVAAKVLDASSKLSEQEGELHRIREEMKTFLLQATKVG